jgi:hypothetical protein
VARVKGTVRSRNSGSRLDPHAPRIPAQFQVLVEDGRGVRTRLAAVDVKAGTTELARVAAPASGTRVVAVYRGTDTQGEPIVAVGAMPLAR